ncbi:Uncharacterised protein [Mycobacteroides abscessus subsp. massiliense]|uniref:hypothetical protein n=1 Tax=Mycobacteroides abscessus TaxID=36809 RepID=UPI0009A80DF3|nr:hypothetical protein [Mycobacteroides abscessus]SKM80772.1 Uncharacterised protein [Mycobacteroides abscessus subsp. massiliense]SKM97106.1 Uncharacterised protein [Mycobacteroides abscessus subsp. massiliense]SKN76038.1 Uncharacterised protein [Mycobacteroides abscessus subsp. massiliense]SKN97176.1 Uncharacterised protein [Mycobacteroides abscessus subsp. massiliense]SKO20695.1 Uncharacterised protein [Mycobacteroides abscessus subsp. massiliense]
MVKTLAGWRDQLFNLIADKITVAVEKRLAVILARFEAQIAERIDEAVDRITDVIPGTLDDKVLDGIVGKLLARIPFLGGGGR